MNESQLYKLAVLKHLAVYFVLEVRASDARFYEHRLGQAD